MRPRPHPLRICLAPLGIAVLVAAAGAQEDVQDLSLDALLNTEISTAAKYAQTAGEAAASVSIVTPEDIQRYGYRTVAEALRSLCGFYGSYDRNYDYLGARGFGRPTDYNNRILLLVDGHSINENVYGSAPVGSDLALDLDDVERIEVVRGPGSVLYGTGAMLAVVNVLTRPGRSTGGVRAAGELGSFGSKRVAGRLGRPLTRVAVCHAPPARAHPLVPAAACRPAAPHGAGAHCCSSPWPWAAPPSGPRTSRCPFRSSSPSCSRR